MRNHLLQGFKINYLVYKGIERHRLLYTVPEISLLLRETGLRSVTKDSHGSEEQSLWFKIQGSKYRMLRLHRFSNRKTVGSCISMSRLYSNECSLINITLSVWPSSSRNSWFPETSFRSRANRRSFAQKEELIIFWLTCLVQNLQQIQKIEHNWFVFLDIDPKCSHTH